MNKIDNKKTDPKLIIALVANGIQFLILCSLVGVICTIYTATPHSSVIEVQDFHLEEVDLSRVKNNDAEYTAMMVADAESSLAIWMMSDTLRSDQEEIAAVEMTIKYLQSIYDALPKNVDAMDRIFIETILDGTKDHLEELKEDYNQKLELMEMMQEMRDTMQQLKER